MIRGLNSPIRSYDQAKSDIVRSRREQFSKATPGEKKRLVKKWIEQAVVVICRPDNNGGKDANTA